MIKPYHVLYSCFLLGLVAIFLGCANESVYRGGIGAFKDYDSISSYRSMGTSTLNYINQPSNNEVFSNMGRSFNASNALKDSFSGGKTSLIAGMRESESIQRATMKPYQIAGKWYYPSRVKIGQTFDGIASWYGPNFHSKATSNGEKYNMYAHTAASKTLPMNTIVKVYNKENNKTTIVRINDRGPFVEGRIIDLSNIAAKDIDMIKKGTAKVRIEVIGFGGKVDKNYQNSLNVATDDIKDEFEVGESKGEVEGGIFALQVGVFKQKSGAESTKAIYDKKAEQYNTHIKQDNDLYRVFIQGFHSEDEARDFASSNNLTPIIIRD